MQSLLPFDLTEIIQTELAKDRRRNDHLAHPSSHLVGSLRHAQLAVAGAPMVASELVRDMPLWIGTLLHEEIHRFLRTAGVPYMAEVNLTPWLPKGWAGTADAVVWHPELKGFVLADFKTSKGESMRYIVRDGAKEEHKLQSSAYWHALKKMGLPMVKAIGVYYLPKNDTRKKDELIEPALIDFEPIPARTLHADMKHRWGRISDYVTSLGGEPGKPLEETPATLSAWLTDELEAVEERQQRVYFDRKTETWELKLVPHWSTEFCPFPERLCDCSTQGTTKLGVFDIDGSYYPRKGFEQIEPRVEPPVG